MSNSVSFSQLSMYGNCNYQWYLTYVKKLSESKQTIHLLFGSSMHTVLQNYLYVVYNNSAKSADELDLSVMLKEQLSKNFTKAKDMTGKEPCTKEELIEFYKDGIEIINYLKKHRNVYFSKKGFELLGTEIHLKCSLNNNIEFTGYIDIAIKNIVQNKIKITDFKTSTNGWKDYQKKDDNKTSQLLLYKKFYAEKFNFPVENIEVEFIILKRKLYEEAEFPQKRIQRFSPASGKPSINKATAKLNEFVNTCFTEDGHFNEDRIYLKADDINKCRFCEYNNTIKCDHKN